MEERNEIIEAVVDEATKSNNRGMIVGSFVGGIGVGALAIFGVKKIIGIFKNKKDVAEPAADDLEDNSEEE